MKTAPCLAMIPLLLMSACSLSGTSSVGSVDTGLTPDRELPTRSNCPDFSGRYTTLDDGNRLTERTITQSKCDEIRFEDLIHSTIPGREQIERSEKSHSTDQVCRVSSKPEDKTQACEAFWFTRSFFVTSITNKTTPGVDHAFRAGLFSMKLQSDGSIVETFEYFGPQGQLVRKDSRTWTPVGR